MTFNCQLFSFSLPRCVQRRDAQVRHARDATQLAARERRGGLGFSALTQPISQAARPSKEPKTKETADKPASKTSDTARGQLKLGSALPKLTLLDDRDEEVDVAALAGERGVVLFLYPRVGWPKRTNSRRTRRGARTRRAGTATSMRRLQRWGTMCTA